MAKARDRPGFLRSLPRPSRTEGIVIAVLLLVTAVAVGAAAWHASNRTPVRFDAPEAAATEAAPMTPDVPAASEAPAIPATPPAPPVLAFYGDWFVSGTEQGGFGPTGWPALVSQRIGADGRETHAVTDSGYVRASVLTGDTFATLAERHPEPDADVTIVFGSRNDYLATPAQITAAATRAFDVIRATAPQTRLLVIGPAWTGAVVPPELLPVRDAVRQAATAAGATFVDPLEQRWFSDDPGLIGTDSLSPTDEGHAYLADRIEPLVRDVLANASAVPAAATGTP